MATLTLNTTSGSIGWRVDGWLTEYALTCRAELWQNGVLVDYDEQAYSGPGYISGSTTSYSGVFAGLDPSTTYTVHVYAYRGDSQQTAHLSGSATTDAPTPPPPTGPQAYIYGYRGSTLGWHPATPYVYHDGQWREATPKIYSGGWN